MTTSLNSAKPARDLRYELVHVIRATVNYNDPGIATGIAIGTVPKNAVIIGTDVAVLASFNAATTNVFTVGSNSTQQDNLIASAFDEATIANVLNTVPTGVALGVLSADTTFYAKYTQTGPAATSGKAVVMIKYVVQETPS